jgi:anti-sigma factor RsiW
MRLRAPELVCRQAIELMSDYLDGSLSRRDLRRLERHLAACDACAGYLDQLRVVIATTGAVGPHDLDDDTVEGLVDLFRRYRDDPGHDDDAGGTGAPAH